MALIRCPECGKRISDKARQCIHCGFPLDMLGENALNDQKSLSVKNVAERKIELTDGERQSILIVRVLVGLIIILLFVFFILIGVFIAWGKEDAHISEEPRLNTKADDHSNIHSNDNRDISSVDTLISNMDGLSKEEWETINDRGEVECVESSGSEDDSLAESEKDDVDINDIVDELTWYEYEERNRKKDDLFSYYDYMTNEQKRECLALYLFYQEAPDAVEEKIKNSLKNPASYTLYSMEVSSVITYDEERDEFTGFIDITYGGTNSFGGMEKETDNVWIDFAVDIETKDIYIRDVTIWDL